MTSTTATIHPAAAPVTARRFYLREHGWEALLALGSCLILLLLAWRNYGLYPSVFADELSYSTFSRLTPLGEAIVPSYLYLWLFGASSACGTAFLECVRFGNELLLVASAPFIYLTARQVCPRPAAVVVTLAALAGPVNTYTAYFMPESTYFFSFAVLAWASLRNAGRDWVHLGLAGGVLLGLMSLVKVHALFLLPAQCLFAVAAMYLNGGPWLRRAAAGVALTLAAWLVVRFGVGYLLAGEPGLYLFGPLYGNQAQGNSGRWLTYLPHAWANLQGHLMGLALMFTFPLALMGHAALHRNRAHPQGQALSALQLYALFTLGASLGMAVLYTASLYAIEGLRIHARYYNFTFPLLFIVAAAAWRAGPSERRVPAALLAVAGAAALLYATLYLGARFRVLIADGAEVAVLMHSGRFLMPLAAIQLLVLIAWLVRVRVAALLYLVLFLPLFVVVTTSVIDALVAKQRIASGYDNAGLFARARLAPADLAQLTITGAPTGELMRTKFHLDAPAAKIMDMRHGVPLELSQVPATSKWLLLIGEHALPPGLAQVADGPGYRLFRLPGPVRQLGRIDFTSARPELALLAGAEGLSAPEPWGRWSDGPQVRLRLAQPLPRKLILILNVRAFGPNVGQDFVARVGTQERRFKADEAESERALQFDTDGSERELVIEIPAPSNPTVDGKIVDGRKLGLGLTAIRLATPPGN